jgi:hypothetical protein
LIQELRNSNIFVRILRFHDAVENYTLKKACKHERYTLTLNIVDLKLRKEMVKWNKGSRLCTEESERCLMMLELMEIFMKDHELNVPLLVHTMRF